MNQRISTEDQFEIEQKPVLIPNPLTGFDEATYATVDTSAHHRPPPYNPEDQFRIQLPPQDHNTRDTNQFSSASVGGLFDSSTGLPLVKMEDTAACSSPPSYSAIADDLDVSDSDDEAQL